MRPISVISILSRISERILVRDAILPALHTIPPPLVINNQFAYQPTSSTTAALVVLLAKITELLKSNDYVFCLTFDYSKAFDTISHNSVAEKLARLHIPDYAYNWVIDYLSERSHTTMFGGVTSPSQSINASIVQGSVLGPNLFNINSSELVPFSSKNFYFKYADDATLLIPSSNLHSLHNELEHHENWATSCNLKFNLSKTVEMVIPARRSLPEPHRTMVFRGCPPLNYSG